MAFASGVNACAADTLKDILAKNIQASGGKDFLAGIQNVSFRSSGAWITASANGDLKSVSGKDSVITEVILVSGGKAQRNLLGAVTDIVNPQKAIYQTLAKLYAGLFSVQKFEGELKLEGVRAFGPEKLYQLASISKADGLDLNFFLRTDDFRLKRLVFHALSPQGEKVEINYDFGPFEDNEGLKLPRSWFISQVGARGTLTEASDIKTNVPLPKDFFTSLAINMGETQAGPGFLTGNILDFGETPGGFVITSNWTKGAVEKAGFKTGDRLTLKCEKFSSGFVTDVVFFESAEDVPPPNELGQQARILCPSPREGGTYIIRIVGMDMSSVAARLAVLDPIDVRKF